MRLVPLEIYANILLENAKMFEKRTDIFEQDKKRCDADIGFTDSYIFKFSILSSLD